jgi:hypothetical protein
MPNKQTALKIVTPDPHASIMTKGSIDTPFFEGNDSEDLVCGSCGAVIAKGVSLKNISTKVPIAVPQQLVVKCICNAYNLLPVQLV